MRAQTSSVGVKPGWVACFVSRSAETHGGPGAQAMVVTITGRFGMWSETLTGRSLLWSPVGGCLEPRPLPGHRPIGHLWVLLSLPKDVSAGTDELILPLIMGQSILGFLRAIRYYIRYVTSKPCRPVSRARLPTARLSLAPRIARRYVRGSRTQAVANCVGCCGL